ncbi:hypothetical protein FORC71_3355 [Vibrio parahaemolyticus]|nr:hypothetical protein FORC71_3355 [Vibrio parahaemolyticus]
MCTNKMLEERKDMPYEPTIKRNLGQLSIELHFPKEAMRQYLNTAFYGVRGTNII